MLYCVLRQILEMFSFWYHLTFPCDLVFFQFRLLFLNALTYRLRFLCGGTPSKYLGHIQGRCIKVTAAKKR